MYKINTSKYGLLITARGMDHLIIIQPESVSSSSTEFTKKTKNGGRSNHEKCPTSRSYAQKLDREVMEVYMKNN